MKFAKLTAPNGDAMWISETSVVSVIKAVGGARGANSEVVLNNGKSMWVREQPEDVVKIIQVASKGRD